MKYADGQEVMLGDKVSLGGDSGGVVVGIISSGQFADGFPATEWLYLKRGILVQFPRFGLIHYETVEPDVALVSRF